MLTKENDLRSRIVHIFGQFFFNNEVIRVLTSHLGASPPFQSWGDQPAPVLLHVTDPRCIPPPNSPQTQDWKGLELVQSPNDKFNAAKILCQP